MAFSGSFFLVWFTLFRLSDLLLFGARDRDDGFSSEGSSSLVRAFFGVLDLDFGATARGDLPFFYLDLVALGAGAFYDED